MFIKLRWFLFVELLIVRRHCTIEYKCERGQKLIEIHFQTLIGPGGSAPPHPPAGGCTPWTPAQGEAPGFRRKDES